MTLLAYVLGLTAISLFIAYFDCYNKLQRSRYHEDQLRAEVLGLETKIDQLLKEALK